MADLAIGGILVVGLILGLVEFAKKFGLQGNGLIVMAFVLAVVFSALAMLIADGTIPAAVAKWIILVVASISFGLGIPGLYDLRKADQARGSPVVTIESVETVEVVAKDDADADEALALATEAEGIPALKIG